MGHAHRIKRHIKHIASTIQDFSRVYTLLAICYVLMFIFTLIKLVHEENEKNKWYITGTLIVYIMVAVSYIMLSFYSRNH